METTADDGTQVRTWEMPADAADDMVCLIERANRRATRAGLPGYVYTCTPGPGEKVTDRAGNEIGRIPTVIFTVGGEVPRLGDYEPVATLTRDPAAGVITRVWPGHEDIDLSQFRAGYDADGDVPCDHCHTRRDRLDTYVVRHRATGQLFQIGRTCLAVFTGITFGLPVAMFSDLEDAEEFGSGGFGGADAMRPATLAVLAATVVIVREIGYTSRADSGPSRDATSDIVRDVMRSLARGGSREPGTLIADLQAAMCTDEVRERAAAVRGWATGIDWSDRSEYAANLAALARADTVEGRNVGILASAVAAYHRAVEREREAARTAASQWVGTVGERITADVEIISCRVIGETQWGMRWLVAMADRDGNRFVWFTGAAGPDEGSRVRVTATVKEHGEYRGVQQTVLTRCRFQTA